MYRKYAKIKRKYKSKRILRPSYISLLLVIIMITMAVGYSKFQERLEINGTVVSTTPPLDIIVYPTEGGRHTVNSDLRGGIAVGRKETWVVTSEVYDQETQTHVLTYKDNVTSLFGFLNGKVDFELTLVLHNLTEYNFENGKIDLVERVDSNLASAILTDYTYQIETNKENFPGDSDAIIKIKGVLHSGRIFQSDATYKFRITYDEPNADLYGKPKGTHYFWFTINFLK